MRAASFDTYEQYCEARRAAGYQVISRDLFEELKESRDSRLLIKAIEERFDQRSKKVLT